MLTDRESDSFFFDKNLKKPKISIQYPSFYWVLCLPLLT